MEIIKKPNGVMIIYFNLDENPDIPDGYEVVKKEYPECIYKLSSGKIICKKIDNIS